MSYNQALSAYRETRVKTASQGSLIVMLYDEAIKQLRTAVAYIENDCKKNPALIEKINDCVLKAQEVITELMASLDMEAGGEISRNLLALYSYFNQELLAGNVNKDGTKLAFVCDMMDQLRMAWAEAANSQAAPRSTAATAGVNIAG